MSRLEELKKNRIWLKELEDLFNEISNVMMPPYVAIEPETVIDVKKLIKYAKEQAESVEKLEKELDKDANISFSLEGQLNDALDNVERYKQALEEIAKETGTPYADIAIKALEESE